MKRVKQLSFAQADVSVLSRFGEDAPHRKVKPRRSGAQGSVQEAARLMTFRWA
jgi:hypothetical protein